MAAVTSWQLTFFLPLQLPHPTPAHCSPQSTVWKSSSCTSHHSVCTGHHTRGTHSVPSARAALLGLHTCSLATSMLPITTTRICICDSTQCYKSLILTSVCLHNCRLRDNTVALELLHILPFRSHDQSFAVFWVLSFLIVRCNRRYEKINRVDHLGNQKEFEKLNMIHIMFL